MGAELLLQTLAAPLGAALLSWRWPRLGYLWGALALWLVGSLLGGLYGIPAKAWQWLPLTLLVPAIAAQVNDQRGSLLLFAVFSALVWWQGLASVLASEPGIWLALLSAILWFGWSTLHCDSREGLGFALGFIWLALVIGIDGSLLIAQLAGALAAFAGFRALLATFVGTKVAPPVWRWPSPSSRCWPGNMWRCRWWCCCRSGCCRCWSGRCVTNRCQCVGWG